MSHKGYEPQQAGWKVIETSRQHPKNHLIPRVLRCCSKVRQKRRWAAIRIRGGGGVQDTDEKHSGNHSCQVLQSSVSEVQARTSVEAIEIPCG
jgi:hypothetical protein